MAEDLDRIQKRLDSALERLQEIAQGRVYTTGTKVIFRGKFGVITNLLRGSVDPTGSMVTVRLDDGTVIENVSVTSSSLQLYKQ